MVVSPVVETTVVAAVVAGVVVVVVGGPEDGRGCAEALGRWSGEVLCIYTRRWRGNGGGIGEG